MNIFSREKTRGDFFAITLEPKKQGATFSTSSLLSEPQEAWGLPNDEGKLAIDIAHTEKDIIVVSTMAGAVPDKIDVFIHNDLLTIRGVRSSPVAEDTGTEYYYRECFWGKFSRTIVLPTEVKGEFARAEYKNGILTIMIPKRSTDAHVSVVVVDE